MANICVQGRWIPGERKDLPQGGKPRSPTWVFHLSAPSALTYAGAERKNAQPSFAIAVKQWSQRWIPWMFRKNRLRLWYYLQLSAFWELATGFFGAVFSAVGRIGLIFALPNSQDGKDQTLQHHLKKLQQEPEPPSRGLLPSLTAAPFHSSPLGLVEKPFEIYLNFLFGGEKVLGQDSWWNIFFRKLDDHISLKK